MKIKDKKGFSLLELLVVVLIIGILAAVVLPQYQLAVDKTHFVQYQSMVAALRNAYYDYILIYGKSTSKFENLSLTMPDDFYQSKTSGAVNCMSNYKMFCCLLSASATSSGDISCGNNDLSLIYQEQLVGKDNALEIKIMCKAKENNKRAERVCKSLGRFTNANSAVWTPEGLLSDYNRYLLK